MATPIEIAVRTSGTGTARSQLRGVRGEVTGLGASARKLALGGAAAVGITSLVRGVVGLGKASVQAEAEYSTTMRLIAAATKAPQRDMRELNRLAIDLGAKTQFSAGEAASAMLDLAKAGLDTKTIMGGGLAGTLTLAAAGGTELGTASTIASNALNAFNLEGSDMAAVAAAIAGGANKSSASVESLGQGLAQVGAGAVNAGLDLNETVAALSAFDAAGVKGSDAGTSLKTMLQRLVPTTTRAKEAMRDLGLDFTNAEGEFVSLESIAGKLRKGLGGLTEEERTRALTTIFGSDATRAASILMRQGESGIRKYIAATKDQDAAQKLANARMKGTSGAVERLSGVIETVKLRIGQELAGAVTGGADALADNLIPMLEAGIDAGKQFRDAVAPGVRAVVDVLRDLMPSSEGAGNIFRDLLIPALETASDLLEFFADVVGAIPEPVKDIGVQVAIAALLLPRLTSAATAAGAAVTGRFAAMKASVRQFGAEMTYAQTRTQRLGQAARGAAGIGGMLALAKGAEKAGTATGDLLSISGGILTGFAVGGPWGAAIGGAATAIGVLRDSTKNAAAEMVTAADKADRWAEALGGVTSAQDKLVRGQARDELIRDFGDTVKVVERIGISTRDLIGVMTREAGAQQRVTAAIKEGAKSRNVGDQRAAEAARIMLDLLADEETAIAKTIRENRKRNSDLLTTREIVKSLPKRIRAQVTAEGVPSTVREIKELARQYRLTPKEIRSLIRLTGVDASAQEIRRFARAVKGGADDATREANRGAEGVATAFSRIGRVRPQLNPFKQAFRSDLGRVRQDATLGGLAITRELREGTGQARPYLDPFANQLRTSLDSMRGTASSGGHNIGVGIAAGAAVGVRSRAAAVAQEAASLVINALARARHEAKIKSPSRATREIGEQLGAGLAEGMARSKGKTEGAASKMMRDVLKAARDGASPLRDVLRDMLSERKLSGKEVKAALKSLRDEQRALLANADAQQRVADRLRNARQRLAQLRQESKEYRNSVRDMIVASGNVTALAAEEGDLTPDRMLATLRDQLNRAKRFAELVKQLKREGLNATTIDQLLQAGVEGGGLEAAETLRAGGEAVLDEVNAITAELEKVGTQLGTTGANAMYAAGIDAAEGLVQGLADRLEKLDDVGDRLAKRLIRAFRKALKIESPSRVFRDLGALTVDGLRIGLDDARVKRYGEVLASSLVDGFANPDLAARAAWDSATGPGSAPRTLTLKLTAEQLSALQRGREIQADLDAYYAGGGRRTAP